MFAAGNTCRLCLATDAPVHVIAGTPLQNIYEKLTEIPLNCPRRSVAACLLCCSRLRKCHKLMLRSVRAEKVLTQVQQSGNMTEQEFVAMVKQYHLDDGLCVTPTELIAITNTKVSLIKDEVKEERQPIQNRGVMTMASGTLPELTKFEASVDEGNAEREVPIDTEDMDSEEFINEGDVKMEVFEEPLNVERQELTDEAIKLEAFKEVRDTATKRLIEEQDIKYEEIEVIGCDRPEGTPSNNCKEIQDRLTPHEKNIPGRRKLEEHLKKVVISDECGDVSDDKNLLEERTKHRDVGRMTINRKSGEGSSYQYSLLGKHKHTDTPRAKHLFECDICQRKFTIKSNLIVHLRRHTSYGPFECDVCQVKFSLQCNLKTHLRTHTREKVFDCEICKVKFSTRSYLKIHIRTHTGEKPFECDICKVKFIEKSTLSRHLRTHKGEKPFECEICKARFSQKSNLKIHFRTHTGEKPFQCDICKVKFKEKSHLNMHLRTHTGEKPFKCEICKAKFSQKSTLNRHLRTHTDKKLFECEICKLKYSRQSYLKMHLRIHTGEKPFECEICQMKFYAKANLNVHLRTHTGEKPFKCEICKAKFSHKSTLKTHFRTHTGEKPLE